MADGSFIRGQALERGAFEWAEPGYRFGPLHVQ